MSDYYKIIKYPLTTEKSVRLLREENKITFIVDKKANKKEIKEAVEKLFNVKVVRINETILSTGEKKAYVKLSAENPAMDIITQMGLM